MSKGSRTKEQGRDSILVVSGNKKAAAKKKGLSGKAKSAIYISIAAAVFALLIWAIVYSAVKDRGLPIKNASVMTVAGQTIKGPELEFYYHAQKNNLASEANYYQEMLGFDIYGINFNISLFKQEYNSETGQSWGEKLRDAALDKLYELVLLEKNAKDEGYALSEEGAKSVAESMAALEESAAANGVSALQLLRANYGSTVTVESYKKYVEREALAYEFITHKTEGYVFDSGAIASRYGEDPAEFDMVSYYRYSVPVLPEGEFETEEAEDEAQKAETERVKAELEAKLAGAGVDKFFEVLEEYGEEEDHDHSGEEGRESHLSANLYKQNVSDDTVAAWAFAADGKAGDILVLAQTSSVEAYYLTERNTQEYNARSVRHILVRLADETSEEDNAAKKAKAEEILNEWLAGDKTEESFADLARKYSEDSNAKQGGLYENVFLGMMVVPFQDWLFDEGRSAGDTGVVETEYGFHVMYYTGEGELARDALVKDTLKSETFEAEFEAWKTASPLVRLESGIKKVK